MMATAAMNAATFSIGVNVDDVDFSDLDFTGELIDSIDFEELFDGLPDFETEYLSSSGCEEDQCSEINVSTEEEEEEEGKVEVMALIDEAMATTASLSGEESKGDEEEEMVESRKSEGESVGGEMANRNRNLRKWRVKSRRGKSDEGSNYEAKRKVKVDWTPELHRRFVEAVEKLGVDKAVPSRILEMMGIDCLTRHNVASHLQKYRSRRKHLVGRESEAATWSQKRDAYGVPATGGKGTGHQLWHVPIVGVPPPGLRLMHPGFRPLLVWGHPSMESWHRHLGAPQSPTPPRTVWPPLYHYPPVSQVPYALAPPGPCFPQSLPPTVVRLLGILPFVYTSFTHEFGDGFQRFPAPPFPGIPPHALYIPGHGMGQPLANVPPGLGHPPPSFHPTKESIDAVIGDVLAKPWLPLPIGLKPPSVDSVLVELQRQGVAEIPPHTMACA
ncbi:Transcription activator GLK1-like protein [Drosera capensis]